MSASTVSSGPSKPVSIAIILLSIFLGGIHVYIGLVSILPEFGADYHKELTAMYTAFAKQLDFLDIEPTLLMEMLRTIFPGFQVAGGLVLLSLISTEAVAHWCTRANFGLIIVNLLLLVLQKKAGLSFERIAPTLVYIVLLSARLILNWQSQRPNKLIKTKSGKLVRSPKKSKAE